MHKLTICLDDLTMARLMEVADNCHAPPEIVSAAMLRDLLEDDAIAHIGTGEGAIILQ